MVAAPGGGRPGPGSGLTQAHPLEDGDLERRWSWGVLITGSALGVTAALSWWLDDRVRVPLDGALAVVVCGLTETGSSRWVPFLLVLALAVCMTDPCVARAQRRHDGIRMLVLMAVGLPTFAVLNEQVVKPAFDIPRPSHLRMVEAGIIPDLGAFDRLDTTARQDFLRSRLAGEAGAQAAGQLAIHPRVLAHWIRETGHTFPSGHTFNAFVVAVLFLGVALANPTPRRRWLAGSTFVWAVAVSQSRVFLHVHRPVDVLVAALVGTACGALVLAVWWRGMPVRA